MGNCKNQMSFCKIKCRECDFKGKEESCPFHTVDCGGDNVPSFEQWEKIYMERSKIRHEQTGMLDKNTRRSIISTLEEFRTVMGYAPTDKISVLNRQTLAEYVSRLKVKQISRKAKCEKIGQCVARWIRFEMEGKWVIPVLTMPEITSDFERYQDPSPEDILKLAIFYRSTYGKGGGTRKNRQYLWLTFQFKYGLRNGDVRRLKWANIQMVDGKPRLEVIPHKTRLSSKRKVKIWMSMIDYYDLMEYRKRLVSSNYPCSDTDEIFGGGKCTSLQSSLNKSIKALGIKSNKLLYTFRKIAISQVYKTQGKEACVAFSGDEFSTISHYYADVSGKECFAPNSFGFF